MGAVGMLLGFGIGFIGGGMFWMLCEDIITRYISQYIVSLTDPYYLANELLWHSIPYILLIIGVLSLILAGLVGRATKEVG